MDIVLVPKMVDTCSSQEQNVEYESKRQWHEEAELAAIGRSCHRGGWSWIDNEAAVDHWNLVTVWSPAAGRREATVARLTLWLTADSWFTTRPTKPGKHRPHHACTSQRPAKWNAADLPAIDFDQTSFFRLPPTALKPRINWAWNSTEIVSFKILGGFYLGHVQFASAVALCLARQKKSLHQFLRMRFTGTCYTPTFFFFRKRILGGRLSSSSVAWLVPPPPRAKRAKVLGRCGM